MPKTIGIIGSRRRSSQESYLRLREIFDKVYEPGDRIVSGGCPEGGDRFAEEIAKKLGLTITIHYPAWHKYGKAAGLKRNTKVAADADVLIALVAPDRTGGTEDTIKKFCRANPKDYKLKLWIR